MVCLCVWYVFLLIRSLCPIKASKIITSIKRVWQCVRHDATLLYFCNQRDTFIFLQPASLHSFTSIWTNSRLSFVGRSCFAVFPLHSCLPIIRRYFLGRNLQLQPSRVWKVTINSFFSFLCLVILITFLASSTLLTLSSFLCL